MSFDTTWQLFQLRKHQDTRLGKVSQTDLNKTKINLIDYFKTKHLEDVNKFPEWIRPMSLLIFFSGYMLTGVRWYTEYKYAKLCH